MCIVGYVCDSVMCGTVLGKLRAAVGKAHLLTSKKFQQFRELCQRNLVTVACCAMSHYSVQSLCCTKSVANMLTKY